MLPGDPEWSGRQGFRFERTITIRAGTPKEPVPLTGFGVRFRMRHWFTTDGAPLLEFTRDDPELDVDDDLAQIVFTIDAVKMRALPSTLGLQPHQAQLDLIPDGDETLAWTPLAGPFPIDPEVMTDDGS